MWYTISHLCSLAGVDPMIAIGWATGNNAAAYGLATGTVTVGAAADLVVVDAPLGGSTNDVLSALTNGDVPGIGAVITDGVPRFVGRSRNSPPPTRAPVVESTRVLQNFDGVVT
jgi:enamidase